MNKLDRPGASFHSSILSALAHRIHPMPVALTLPIASFDPQDYSRGEPGIQGIVDLVKWDTLAMSNGHWMVLCRGTRYPPARRKSENLNFSRRRIPSSLTLFLLAPRFWRV